MSQNAFETPKPPPLRRSYAVVPGQTHEEYSAMCDRLDEKNAAAGLGLTITIPPNPYDHPKMSSSAASTMGQGKTTDILARSLHEGEDPADFIAPDDEPAVAAAAPQKRPLDANMPAPGAPKKKRARKRAAKATEKVIGGANVWEIVKPDGSIVLAREITFA